MFGLGLPELIIILVLVVIFVNPKEFPGLLRKAGKLVRQMKDMRESFKQSLQGFTGETGAASPATASQPAARVAREDMADHDATEQRPGGGARGGS